MTNDVEHIFMLICYPSTFFDELSFQSFAYFKKLILFPHKNKKNFELSILSLFLGLILEDEHKHTHMPILNFPTSLPPKL